MPEPEDVAGDPNNASSDRSEIPPGLSPTDDLPSTQADPWATRTGPDPWATHVAETVGGSSPFRVDPSEGEARVGSRIGEYEIVRFIAKGGMGYVYEAVHVKLGMPVALKTIVSGSHAPADDLRRFVVEAQAVARLHRHPNIVKIYNINAGDDEPFFVMQFIRCGSAKARAQEFRANPRKAVELMIQVAEAISYAHKKGILHRDLKPENILIDENGTPYVTDFGLAQRVDPTEGGTVTIGRSFAATGGQEGRSGSSAGFESSRDEGEMILGTPSFMPPEQASGRLKDVTTLSDVYGLGATLFALVCGRAPFLGSGVWDILQQVIEGATPSPRTLNAQVDRDLEAICLKCMEKDPSRRYESADAVARELRRWLDGKPVHARPVSWVERTYRRVRREPGKFAASALAVAVLGMAGGFAAWSRYEANRSRFEKELALKNADATMDAASEAILSLVEAFEADLGTDQNQQATKKSMLKAALSYFTGIIQRDDGGQGKDPSRILEDAKAHRIAADLAYKIDPQSIEVEDHYQEAVALLEPLAGQAAIGEEFGRRVIAELGNAYHEFGVFHSERGTADLAMTFFEKGLKVRQTLCAPCTIHGGRRDGCQGRPRDRAALGQSHGYLGDIYLSRGDRREADREYEESHRIRLGVFNDLQSRKDPSEDERKQRDEAAFQLARSHSNLARLRRDHGHPDLAIQEIEQGIRILDDLIRRAPENHDAPSDRAWLYRVEAEFAFENGDDARALQAIDRAVQAYDRLIAERPGAPELPIARAYALSWRNLVLLDRAQRGGGNAPIEDLAREVAGSCGDTIRLLRQRGDERPSKDYRLAYALCKILLGRVALMDGSPKEATDHLYTAIDQLRELLARDPKNLDYHSQRAEAKARLAETLNQAHDPKAPAVLADAIQEQRDALESSTAGDEAGPLLYRKRLSRFQELRERMGATSRLLDSASFRSAP